jgi:hypothetical protein
MQEFLNRSFPFFGKEGLDVLAAKTVAIAGLGGPSVVARFKQGMAKGFIPTTAIGGLASNTLLANEVLVHLLQETGLVDRKPIFAPRFVTLDFMSLEMKICDITRQ